MKQYILVNLLPYRDIERKEQKKQFAFFSVVSIVFGLLAIFMIATYYIARIDMQEQRNKFLIEENKKLETQIVKIKDLKERLKIVMARKGVVEDLQITRSDAVNLLNVIVQKMPDSVYLKSLKQVGDKITVVGVTQSNAKVSGFMRSIEDSPFTMNPQLIEIKAVPATAIVKNTKGPAVSNDKDIVSEFTMTFNIERKKVEEDPKTKARKARTAKAKAAAGITVDTPAVGVVAPAATPAQGK